MKKIIIAAVILIICAGGQKAYAQGAVKNEPTPAVRNRTDAGVSLPAQKGSTPKIIREIPRYHYYDVPRIKVTTYETRVIPVYKFAIWGVTVTADTKTNTIKITGINITAASITKTKTSIMVKPLK